MKRYFAGLLALVFLLSTLASADEGMWLYNAPLKDRIKAKYGFALTEEWLDHVRLSSVRFNNGGSGSFVSSDGLTFTNHHVGAGCIQQLSTEGHDYIKTGFYAKTQAEEAKCPNLELNQLVGIEDVTTKINAGVKPEMSAAEAGQAQRAKDTQERGRPPDGHPGNRRDNQIERVGGALQLAPGATRTLPPGAGCRRLPARSAARSFGRALRP